MSDNVHLRHLHQHMHHPVTLHTTLSRSTHLAHLVLTLCTGGAWGFVWLGHWAFAKKRTVAR